MSDKLRKISVFKPCTAHELACATASRERRAETFVEGGFGSPCAGGQCCTVKPGTDFYTNSFVRDYAVYPVTG